MIVSYNNKIVSYNNNWVDKADALPNYTIRLLYKPGVTPPFSKGTAVQVSQNPNVWDLTYSNTVWSSLLEKQTDLIEVIEANTYGVTNMAGMFSVCTSLTSVPLFDTSNVTTMKGMFSMTAIQSLPAYDTSKVVDATEMCYMCNGLTSIPLLNTSSMTKVDAMFYYCTNVESGALALYNQMSTQANPPSSHVDCFINCGITTVTGAAELAQIPDDWK